MALWYTRVTATFFAHPNTAEILLVLCDFQMSGKVVNLKIKKNNPTILVQAGVFDIIADITALDQYQLRTPSFPLFQSNGCFCLLSL